MAPRQFTLQPCEAAVNDPRELCMKGKCRQAFKFGRKYHQNCSCIPYGMRPVRGKFFYRIYTGCAEFCLLTE